METYNTQAKLSMSEFDKKIGRRLKELRLRHGFTQQAIGDVLGVTFQQTQKYETGVNRVSARTLYILKGLYNIEWEDFFNSIEAPLPLTKLAKRPRRSIDEAFYNIDSPEVQKSIFELITEISRLNEGDKDA